MEIIIDTQGESNLLLKDKLIDSDDDLDFNCTNFNPLPTKHFTNKNIKKNGKPKKFLKNDIDLDEFEEAMGWTKNDNKLEDAEKSIAKISNNVTELDKILEKSVIKPGFEQLETVPKYEVSRRIHQKEQRKLREKNKGQKWFNMPATEMTPEIKHDLQIIQMRSVLEPKHFYKKNDIKALPKYFQVGKVVDSPVDYYSGRLTNKERKNTIVDELMNDAEFAKYNKRKYREIINSSRHTHSKAHQHAKKLKKKK